MGSFIEIDNICYSVKKNRIIQQLSLNISSQEFVAIVGENGSGKTTLTKLIMGIIPPNAGKIAVDGQPVTTENLAQTATKIGYLFQNPTRQIFCATVEEELSFVMTFNKVDKVEIKKKLQTILEQFDLEKVKNQTCHTLSQGEKQRLALAEIMLRKPSFLLLDEPTTGLDTVRKQQLGERLKALNEQGVGILFISHDLDFVNEYAQRMITIQAGKVVRDEKL